MKRISSSIIGIGVLMACLTRANAITVEEVGVGAESTAVINATGIGTVVVVAGVLKLDVDGVPMDGFCIDPFHFSEGSMAGYTAVPLTDAPKGRFMSAATALDIEKLWGSYYSPTMSAANAAGIQIAVWELTGGSDFQLISANDFGAAGFLAAVEDANYSGPIANLVGLTGPGQDYTIDPPGGSQMIPDGGATLSLLVLGIGGILGVQRRLRVC